MEPKTVIKKRRKPEPENKFLVPMLKSGDIQRRELNRFIYLWRKAKDKM